MTLRRQDKTSVKLTAKACNSALSAAVCRLLSQSFALPFPLSCQHLSHQLYIILLLALLLQSDDAPAMSVNVGCRLCLLGEYRPDACENAIQWTVEKRKVTVEKALQNKIRTMIWRYSSSSSTEIW